MIKEVYDRCPIEKGLFGFLSLLFLFAFDVDPFLISRSFLAPLTDTFVFCSFISGLEMLHGLQRDLCQSFGTLALLTHRL